MEAHNSCNDLGCAGPPKGLSRCSNSHRGRFLLCKDREGGCRTLKKTYNFAGQQVPGEEVEFEAEIDRFNVYLLADGTKVKVKAAVLKIVRLDAWTADGDPIYLVNTQPMVASDVPDSLKRRQQ